MRLSARHVAKLPGDVARYSYDRKSQNFGIVHFGLGAFHRAHQAWYTDLVMDAGERDWSICGVSLRSRSVADQLVPQDGIYTLIERSAAGANARLIGAVGEVLYAPDQRQQAIERIASPSCHIVSFTVTEKGYARCHGGALDFASAETSFYPLLAQGLALREKRGLAGLTLLPCDNLADNGNVLRRLVTEWIARRQAGLADWFEHECSVVSAMVDRIVPRTTEIDLAELEDRIGLADEGAVFTEPFSQWVIEDNFAGPRPRWEDHGAQVVDKVAPYETAKLRMLNGAHSLLAYCGLRRGYRFVHEAVHDAELRELARRLMIDEAAPTVVTAPGQDLHSYAGQLLERFANPALEHRLAQIAMDGTEKLPQRWLDTLRWHRSRGGSCPSILAGLDAWRWHVEDGRFLDDPRADYLRNTVSADPARFYTDCFGDDVADAVADIVSPT